MTSLIIPRPKLAQLVRSWLDEDVPSFDIGGAVVGSAHRQATLFMKQSGVIAGATFFDAVFAELNCKVVWKYADGAHLSVNPGERIVCATVSGEAQQLLLGERIALNILARASGIATRCHEMIVLSDEVGWHGTVAGTRKTTPGFRLVEKQAMLIGGVDTHRMDLSSMVMLKDNHIWSKGSITAAVKDTRKLCGFSTKIEVECGSEDDANEAIDAGADIVMLDNFTPADASAVSQRLKQRAEHVLVEVSGGITKETIQDYMLPSVDVLSTSWVHQGCPHIDFSLKIDHSESTDDDDDDKDGSAVNN